MYERFKDKRKVSSVPLKNSEFASLCPCGSTVKGFLGMPTRFKPQISKLSCRECGSQFMATTSKLPKKGNRYRTNLKVLKLTPMAEDKIRARLLNKK